MLDATIETLYMSFMSLAISWIIALPLGSIVSETRPGGLFPSKVINFILNRIVDVGRSIPFILLVVFLFPFTRMLIGTAIGTKAMIVPLTICAIPFEIRLIEEILSEVPYSIIEAAQIDGASNLKIIIRIKWACKVPYLVNALGITLINIIGYSAMAGVVGGGGLGNYAIVYGFQRFNWNIIAQSVVIIVILVSLIQIINNLLVRFLLRRCLCIKH
ncbi:MAG: ABC transporter permease [Bacilli bacterium]|nr:ABC transporter permease [Bacilli bacterium]